MAKTQLVDLVSLNKIYSNLISNLDYRYKKITEEYEADDKTLQSAITTEVTDRKNAITSLTTTVNNLNAENVKLAGWGTDKANTITATNTFKTGKTTFEGGVEFKTKTTTFSSDTNFSGANTFNTGNSTFNANVILGTSARLDIDNTKDSTKTTDGAVTIAGGLGVEKTINAETINATNIKGTTLYYGGTDVSSLIDNKVKVAVSSAFIYKGQKNTYIDLPTVDNKKGDVWDVKENGHNYVWNGTAWDDLGDSATDFSIFQDKITKYLTGSSVTDIENNSFEGSDKITKVGTIKDGTWQGEKITLEYHYSPKESDTTTFSKDASSTTEATWGSTSLVTGVTLGKDANGHITSLVLDSICVPSVTSTKKSLSLDKVENTALSTWAGTTDITTVGTITSGTWHGTPIEQDYHYDPQADSSSTLSAVATSTESATWADTSAVTAVSLQRDDKGHVTGLNVMSRKFKFDNISTDVAFTSTTESNAVDEGAITISGGLGVAGNIYGSAVYNAVWNDIADCIEVDCELTAGYCYSFDGEHYYRTNEYMDGGCIGIHSDTAGMHVGSKGGNEMEVAIGGFVLAYVDKEYKVGTPLTCTEGGMLTEIKLEDKRDYPERIIATYWKNEPNEEWGSDTRKVKVNGRKWVKIK